MLHKISKNKKCAPKLILFNEKIFLNDSDDFWRWKLTLKIRSWHFLTSIFGHLTSLKKKSNPFLWSVQSYHQSEMFLSNSIDMMKNLLLCSILIPESHIFLPLTNFHFTNFKFVSGCGKWVNGWPDWPHDLKITKMDHFCTF